MPRPILTTAGNIEEISVVGQYAYAVLGHGELRVINVSNPADPVQVAVYDLPDAESLALVDDRIYVTASEAGLFIVNVTPSNGDPVSLSKE